MNVASPRVSPVSSWPSRLGFVSILFLFCAPLFIGLRGTDLRSDEAIYSYEVDRILDTGEWLTPRSIPSDEPFLEKPPLKPWIVAGLIKAGILPADELGLRFMDALFGAVAFAYVFWLGVRLGGAACGFVAVLTLFTLAPLIFDHGLRSDNMEGALFLAYCGGMSHFVRWADAPAGQRSRRHAWAAVGFFVLGFMTKFVAVLFMPIVWLVALAVRPDARARVSAGWRDWILPVTVALVAVTPWFVYESVTQGEKFWHIIFGEHVFKRFTTSLNPTHIHAWHYYFTESWAEFGRAGAQIIAAAGAIRLSIAAWRGESWLARAVWLWAIVPLTLMSIGSSKLIHYAYPYWPPMCLAAGLAFASALRAVSQWVSPSNHPAIGSSSRPQPSALARRLRAAVFVVAAGLAFITAWTWLIGPIYWHVGELTLFRNTSIVRPGWFAVILLCVALYATTLSRLGGAIALAFVLPHAAYADRVHHLDWNEHPLRATRDCMMNIRDTGLSAGTGVFVGSGNVLHHSYYYYLWRTGPFAIAPEFSQDETFSRLTLAGGQTPVILTLADYDRIEPLAPFVKAMKYEDEMAILFPGPFDRCVAQVLAAGGRPVAQQDVKTGRDR